GTTEVLPTANPVALGGCKPSPAGVLLARVPFRYASLAASLAVSVFARQSATGLTASRARVSQPLAPGVCYAVTDGERTRSHRRANHSVPGVSLTPWAMIEQNTTSAARLKISVPAVIRSFRTSSANVMVATPLGPNQPMKPLVTASVSVP